MKKHFRIALAGNPNCGKTSIFNALTGARQHVGNYPGVTVESKTGYFTLNDMEIELIDLPGIYSLSSSSPEEEVAFRELTRPGIDLILNVVDSTIPRRSLYLTTQLAELHIPMLLDFNMSDDARKKGLKYDIPKLETYFGAPIVQTVGCRSDGVRPLLRRLEKALTELDDHGMPMLSYGADIDDAIRAVAEKIDALNIEHFRHIPARFFAIKLLEHDAAVTRLPEFAPVLDEVEEQIRHLREKHAIEADTFLADRRYAMLAGACRNTISMTQERRREISDRIDAVMTNQFLGLPLFILIMLATFWFTFICADPFMGYIEDGFAWLADVIKSGWPEERLPYLRSLLTDGVISGVGGVLVFLPNILFLFFAIAILEESGYMSRAAFVMDGLMRRFGLQGRSFVPLVLGFGCTVPAIMATRTIESDRDRRTTVMVLPLMSCSARLPIYALIVPAFFPDNYPVMMCLIYVIGIVVALIAARLLKSTLFKGDGEVYLMELPPYRMPTLRSLLLHMWDRGRMYLHKAGTLILAASVILYIANTFPEKKELSQDYDTQIARTREAGHIDESGLQLLAREKALDATVLNGIQAGEFLPEEQLEALENEPLSAPAAALVTAVRRSHDEVTALENQKMAEMMEYTISGRIGHALEPLFRPIGFDWKLTTASIAALAAKEVFVSQLGILYAEGETDQESIPLRQQLLRHYTPLQGFCVMLFCLLSVPCLATLAIIKRELNSWKWVALEAAGLFLLAYILTLIVYQTGSLLRIGTSLVG